MRPLRPPAPGTSTRPLTIQPQPAPSPPSRIFRRSPASSSFVLAAARLRALQLDPGRAASRTGSCEEGHRRTVKPSPAARVVTGPDPYALLTTVALMGAEESVIRHRAHNQEPGCPGRTLIPGDLGDQGDQLPFPGAEQSRAPRLRCREDPLPQPPYVLLGRTPVHRVPARELVLRSRCGVQLAHRFPRPCHRHSSRAHLTRVSALSGPGTSPVSGQLSGTAGGGASHDARFPAAFRPPAFASRVILFPPGN